MKKFFLLFFLFTASIGFAQQIAPTFSHLKYGEGINNWLNIYQAESNKPTPVLIWAHHNGATAKGFPKPLLDSLLKNRISVVNWESIPQIVTAEDIDTAENDFYKMFAWVKANAIKYNFDLNNIFISGGSRGTVISFAGANKLFKEIKGIYFVEAVPVRSWLVRDFTKMVTPNSPKMILSYINPFGTTNMHNPDKAVAIVEQYKKLGIGDKIKLYQGVGKEHIYDQIIPFILEGK